MYKREWKEPKQDLTASEQQTDGMDHQLLIIPIEDGDKFR